MDIAIYCHAGDKKIIVANDYDGWPEERRDGMKPHLQCPACRAPVHFRRRSRDGKDPCFVAQHESGCPMASSPHYIAAVAATTIKEVEQIIKDTSILEVDMSLPDSAFAAHRYPDPDCRRRPKPMKRRSTSRRHTKGIHQTEETIARGRRAFAPVSRLLGGLPADGYQDQDSGNEK